MRKPRPSPSTDPAGPGTISDRQQFADELNRARQRAGLTVREVARAAGVPHSTVGGYLTGRHLPPVSQPALLPDILRACGVVDREAIDRWQQALARVRRLPGPRPADAVTPYRGLASYQPEHAEWFFGRQQATRTLVELLDRRWSGGEGPVALVGPSGSGKSSLLRAGLIPALRQGALAAGASAAWPVLLCSPGGRPLATLATQLSTVTGLPPDEIATQLRTDPAGCARLVQLANRRGPAAPGGMVIVVDQFEEIFTECTDAEERQRFLAGLHAAATARPGADGPDRHGPAAVLLGLRADFYWRALRKPLLVPVLQRSQVAIGPMNQDELREAIVAPARKAGLDVEDGLVEILLRDLAPPADCGSNGAAHEAGALPLLSHALRATWERGTRWRLTVADYEAVGGVRGAVARTADSVFESLNPVEQLLARQLFVRLVRVGEGTPNTRRRAAHAELETLATGGGDALGEVLDRFVAERLITVDAEAVEITHEALVAAWPRLRAWIDADRRGLLMAQRLEDDAWQWRRDGRDPAMLYAGARLAAVQEWTETAGPRELSSVGQEFLGASVRRERRRVRLLYQTIAALTALLLLAVTGGVLALQQRGEALTQRAAAADERNQALSRMVSVRADRLRGSDPALASQLALVAFQIAPTVEARSSLLSSSAGPTVTRMLGSNATVVDLDLHPARGLLVAADGDGVLVWDVADPLRPERLAGPLPHLEGVVHGLRLDPDGQVLAVGGGDHTVHLYDLTDPADPADLDTLTGPDDVVTTVAFSPDGQLLAAGVGDGTVHLWDLSTSPPSAVDTLVTAPEQTVTSVAFSPDGRLLVAGGQDRLVHRWDLADPAGPTPAGEPLSGPERSVHAVAFSPDGAVLAAGSGDERAYLWQVADTTAAPAEVLTAPSGSGPVQSIAFSGSGRALATGSGDGLARLWKLADGQVAAALPHPGPLTGLRFEPGGQGLYTAAADGTVRRWALPGPVLRAPTGAVWDLVHHPTTPVVIAASDDGHLYLWDVANPQGPLLVAEPVRSPDPDGPLVGTVAISPDGGTLAAAAHDGTIWRWDIADPARPVLIDAPLISVVPAAETLAFNPDGTVLAAGVSEGIVQLWDLTAPHEPSRLATIADSGGDVSAVAFSPNGQVLAVGDGDRLVSLWQVSDPARPTLLAGPLPGLHYQVDTLAFSPDGSTLVVGGADETILFFDVSDPTRPRAGPVLTGTSGAMLWVAFSPDGRQLTAASRDHTIWQWDLSEPRAPDLHAVLTGPEGRVNMVAYHPDGHTLAASSSDTTVRLFRIVTEEVAASVCAVAGDPITSSEWEQHVPGVPYQPPC